MKGFRAFKVTSSLDGGEPEPFLSPATDLTGRLTPLEYPMVRALCVGRGNHRAPAVDCMCGYHAYSKMGGAADYLRIGQAGIMAEVWGHGLVRVHESGWRSEKLQIVHFYFPYCDDSRGCRTPATWWWQTDVGFQVETRFGCDSHAAARTSTRTGRAGNALAMDFTATSSLRPIEKMVQMLGSKFGAGMVDADATARVYAENYGWKNAIRESSESERIAGQRQRDIDARFRQVSYRQGAAKEAAKAAQVGLEI